MLGVSFLCVGKMKEAYYEAAFAEYRKRLGTYCRFALVEIPEQRLSDAPSEKELASALEKEAVRRISLIDLQNRLDNADEVGFIDIALPSMEGKTTKLSESLGKVTMVYFWSSTAEQKMFNLDSLLPLYEEFHGKGFEIYAVSLDSDKATWASAVRNQQLPWVNVCDTRGAMSPYVSSYGIGSLPMVWFIVDGAIDTEAQARNAAEIRSYLRKKL